jgi:predicted CoA-binding protein
MIKVLGENYYIDLDKVEEYLDMSDQFTKTEETSGNTETRINIIKFEMVKMLMDTVLTEHEEIDEQLGMKSSSNTSIPFRLAFNSLLNKKLINHY